MNRSSEYDYFYYLAYALSTQKKRQAVYISEKTLDKIVIKLIDEEIERLGDDKNIVTWLSKLCEDRTNHYQEQITKYRKSILRLQSNLHALYERYSLTRDCQSDFIKEKLDKKSKIESLSNEIARCEASIKRIDDKYREQVTWVKSLESYRSDFQLSSEVLKTLIERIEVGVNKDVSITFRYQIGGESDD